MLRISLLALLISVNIAFCSVSGSIQVSPENLNVENYPDSTVVRLDGYLSNLEGFGYLPIRTLTYAIGAGELATDVQITSVETDTLRNIQHASRFSHRNAYPTHSLQPAVMLGGTGRAFGSAIAQVVVMPVQYDSIQQTLVFHRRIAFVIHTSPAPQAIPQIPVTARAERIIDQLLCETVTNPSALAMASTRIPKLETDETSGNRAALDEVLPESITAEDIIITSAALADSFEVMADWKRQKGTPTLVVTTEYILQHFYDIDPVFSIKRFIKYAREHYGTLFVTLGGDYSVVPVPTARVTSMDTWTTDVFYSVLDDDWNSNGDWLWAWTGDTSYDNRRDDLDLYPDVFVGRITVTTAADAGHYVRKLLEYEKTVTKTDFQNKALIVGTRLWGDGDAREYCESLADSLFSGYSVDTLYCNTPTCSNTPAITVDSLEHGHAFVFHMSHAHAYGLDITTADHNELTQVRRGDMDAMQSNGRFGFLAISGCYVGKLDVDCIAAHWLKSANGGGVACYAPSDEEHPLFTTLTYFNELMKKTKLDVTNLSFGNLIAASKIPFAPYAVFRGSYERFYLTLNLLGDPEANLWKRTPGRILLTETPTRIFPGRTDTVSFSVLDSVSGEPICYARISFKNHGRYMSLTADQDGVFHLPIENGELINQVLLSPDSAESIRMTAYADGYKPTIREILVSDYSSNHWLEMMSATLLDTITSGFGGPLNNADYDAGETIELFPNVRNHSAHTISGARIEIIGHSPEITLLDSIASLPNILSNHTVRSSDCLKFNLSPTTRDSSIVSLRVRLHAGDSTWNDSIVFRVHAPLFTCTFFNCLDDSGSRRADPGEYANMRFTISNEGSGAAFGVSGALLNYDGHFIRIIRGCETYGNMASRVTVTADTAYRVELLSVSPSDGVIDLKLSMRDCFGRVGTGLKDVKLPLYLSNAIDSLWNETSSTSVTLMWRPAAYDSVIGYNVYDCTNSGSFARINSTTVEGTTRYTVRSLSPRTGHHYAVYAIQNAGVEIPSACATWAYTSPEEVSGFPIRSEGDLNTPTLIARFSGDNYSRLIHGTSSGDIEEVHSSGSSPTGDVFPANYITTGYTTPCLGRILGSEADELIISSAYSSHDSCYLYAFDPSAPLDEAEAVRGFYGQTEMQSPVTISDGNLNNRSYIALITFQGNVSAANRADSMYVHLLYAYFPPTQTTVFSLQEVNGWPKGFASGYSFANPAVGDLDKVGSSATRRSEIVFTDGNGGHIYAYTRGGTQLWKYPAQGALAPLNATPTLADIDGDDTLEVIFMSSDARLYALNGRRGTILSGFSGTTNGISLDAARLGVGQSNQVAVADFDGNGILEMVAATTDSILIFEANGQRYSANAIPRHNKYPYNQPITPLIGDVDNDGTLEIVLTQDAATVGAWKTNGMMATYWPIRFEDTVTDYKLCDVDQTGDLELVALTLGGVTHIADLSDSTWTSGSAAAPWPMLFHDNQHTSCYSYASYTPQLMQHQIDSGRADSTIDNVAQISFIASPNPFNQSIRLSFSLRVKAEVSIRIYNVLGQLIDEIVNDSYEVGAHSVIWNGSDKEGRAMGSGIYFCTFKTAGISVTKKLAIVR